MASSRVTELAARISANTARYNDYLSANGLPEPSFDSRPPDVPMQLPADITAARDAAMEAADELHELLSGPVGTLTNALPRCARTMTIDFIQKYEIGWKLGWGERTTFASIAEEAKLDEDDVRRMLRLAMTDYLFREPEPNVVVHSAASYLLATDPMLCAWMRVTVDENWPPMLKITETMSRYPGSGEPLQSAYCLAHDIKDNPSKVWEKDPARIKQFADAMAFMSSDCGFQPSHVLANSNFSSSPSSPNCVFVDIGGSQGHVSIGLARLYPNMKFIVQDTPETVAVGRARVAEDVRERIEFMAHDFWEEQPVKGADVYFFGCIFHDWSDAYAVRLLRNLIPALRRGARVIISDRCVPQKGEVSLYKERLTRAMDLVMKCFTNAKERDVTEWASLFAKADARFKFVGARTPPGSKYAVIEAEWVQ